MFKKILLPLVLLLITNISYATGFSFKLPDDWSIEQETPFRAIAADYSAMISGSALGEQWQTQSLELVNEMTTFMHHKQFGGEPGTPQPVTGQNWTGILQSQPSGMGGYELQLVAKAKEKTYVFYMATPYSDLTEDDIQALQQILLSLKTD